MIKAKTANIISKEMGEKIIDDAIDFKELLSNMEKLIISHAERGYNFCYCSVYIGLTESWTDIILKKMEPIIKEFESQGYTVILSKCLNCNEISNIGIHLYWGNSIKEYNGLISSVHEDKNEVIYYTIEFFNDFF